MDKIRVTSSVRGLLVELDNAFGEFHALAKKLANRGTGNSEAMDAALDKNTQERIILGIAYRINEASRGRGR